jgi:hypothetical protein
MKLLLIPCFAGSAITINQMLERIHYLFACKIEYREFLVIRNGVDGVPILPNALFFERVKFQRKTVVTVTVTVKSTGMCVMVYVIFCSQQPNEWEILLQTALWFLIFLLIK